jgi:hypothetical protein
LYSIFLTTIPASAAPDPACDFSALSIGAVTATVASEFPDYPPGATVNLSGFGFAPGEIVCLKVTEDNPAEVWSFTDSAIADTGGNVALSVTISADFIAQYKVRAWGLTSGVYAETTFTDAATAAYNLDQCATVDSGVYPVVCDTAHAAQWQNGSLNETKARWFEGDSVPYRARLTDLQVGKTYNVAIQWDTTDTNKHAIDYITSYDRTVKAGNPPFTTSADPCAGFLSPCPSPDTEVIPTDTVMTGSASWTGTQDPGVVSVFNGSNTSLSAYSYVDVTAAGVYGASSKTGITVTFTASNTNAVLAWGGHIASRANWGLDNAATSISGNPFHMRVTSFTSPDDTTCKGGGDSCGGGNQDRALSASAVIFPASITIIKDATPNGSTSFGFTGSPSPLTNFSLVDDGTSANTQTFSGIKDFQAYTVNENSIPAGWGFDSVSCSVTSSNGGSYTASTTTVNIGLKEGENWTCTYLDSRRTGTLTVIKHVVNDNGGTATASQWSIHVKSGASEVAGSPQNGDESGTSYTLTGGTYDVSETGGPSGYTFTGFSGDCDSSGNVTVVAGQSATCTITNDDDAPALHLRKIVTNNNGGTATVSDFTLTADGAGSNDLSGTSPVDSGAGLKADTFALSETNVAGYTASAWVCVGGTQNGANITLGLGQSATCTITNDDQTAHLKLVKVVTNNNGGTAVASNFTLSAAGPSGFSGPGSQVEQDVNAGTYNMSETGPAGYLASAWVCVGGDQNGSSITLANGQSATCTITNDDQTAHLKLVKVVTNNNGGTAVASDFTLSAAGPTPLSGAGGAESDVNAGTYNLSETNVAGYSASAWVCVGGTQNGSNITLGLGQSATCTITNDDQPGTIIVKKLIKPTGSQTSFSFQTSGTGYTGFSLSDGQTNSQTLNAGTYTVKELVPLGWVLTGIGGSNDPNAPYNCTVTGADNGSTGVGDLNTQTATVNLKIGDTVTCVFENTGQGATRTQGFWATHSQLANIAWFGGTDFGHTFPGVALVAGIGDAKLCGRPIDSIGKVMGAFWSDISKKSTGVKRSALDQARMQLLQQLMAAELNASAFGSVPSGGSAKFTSWETAYCGTDQNAIKKAQQEAASFNTLGDSSTFTPGTSADSKNGRAIADVAFWDNLP